MPSSGVSLKTERPSHMPDNKHSAHGAEFAKRYQHRGTFRRNSLCSSSERRCQRGFWVKG